MKISIIIPTFNSEHLVRKAIDSVIDQTYQDWEIWIVDNCSVDGTIDIIREYSKVDRRICYISEPDEGIYDAMNKGIRSAKGEWIYFLGSDDVLHNNTVIEDIATEISQSVFNDVIYGRVYSHSRKTVIGKEWKKNDWVYANVCHQAIFYKRELFAKFGMYELDYKVCGDYAYNLMLQTKDVKWQYVDLVIARFGGNGISNNCFDSSFHDKKEEILYKLYLYLPKKDLYEAKKYYIYNEIRYKHFWKGIFRLVLMIFHTRKVAYHIKNGSYWIKERLLSSINVQANKQKGHSNFIM